VITAPPYDRILSGPLKFWLGSGDAEQAAEYRRDQTNEFDQDRRRMIPYTRFPIGTTFPLLHGTRDTTAALARSSKAVAMYFA
jgi:hypothetical protein